MYPMYTTSPTAKGGGNAQVKSDNGVIDLAVRMSKALGGGDDDVANPEMLFASGYSCLLYTSRCV